MAIDGSSPNGIVYILLHCDQWGSNSNIAFDLDMVVSELIHTARTKRDYDVNRSSYNAT